MMCHIETLCGKLFCFKEARRCIFTEFPFWISHEFDCTSWRKSHFRAAELLITDPFGVPLALYLFLNLTHKATQTL